MYQLLRPALFKLDPEAAHAMTLRLLGLAGMLPALRWVVRRFYQAPTRPVDAFGLTFSNPVGLAAGYDKDGVALCGLAALGFGHIEVGTVTLKPQPGNPRPRLFRLVADRAIINRMGFPSRGADSVARRIRAFNTRNPPGRGVANIVLGVNIGKSKDTPLEEATRDYVALVKIFAPLAGYLAINISSPNTAGLRRLQAGGMLGRLLQAIAAERQEQVKILQRRVPLLVKLSPDLSESELEDALDIILSTGMDGVIATNTTLERRGLRSIQAGEQGGLSGEPLRARSEAILARAVRRLEGRIPIISSGGIMSPADAHRRLDLGAALVQVYTGMIYAGPGLVPAIVKYPSVML